MELVSEKFTRQVAMDGKRHVRPFKASKIGYNVNFAVNSGDSMLVASSSNVIMISALRVRYTLP